MSHEDEAAAAARIVARITAGDSAAEAELDERYRRGLRLLLRQLCRDAASVDDLVQDTLRLTLEKIRRGAIEQPERLAAFLRGTARHLAMGHGRGRARFTDAVADELEARADPAAGALESLVAEEDRRRMRQLLNELRSPRDRDVLLRFHLAEEPKEEICSSLGLSADQFNLVIFRARQRFRQLLEASGWPQAKTGLGR